MVAGVEALLPLASAPLVDNAPISLTDTDLVAHAVADCAIGKVPAAAINLTDTAKASSTKQPRALRAGYTSSVVQAAAGADDNLSVRFPGNRDR